MVNQIRSEAELLGAFQSRDQKQVELPKKLQYPMSFEYYVTWEAPSGGGYRYIVFKKPGSQRLTGMVFRHQRSGEKVSATRLCDWCHAFGGADQIDMLTVQPNSRKTVGMLLCVDLSCVEKVEIVAKASKKNFEQMAQELVERIARFHDENYTTEGRKILTEW